MLSFPGRGWRRALRCFALSVQIVAAIMAITGIVMMAYADGFQGDSIIGVAYAVGSASTSALYKVGRNCLLGFLYPSFS